jgi:hypothetical protein
MRGSVSPLPVTFSWFGAQLSTDATSCHANSMRLLRRLSLLFSQSRSYFTTDGLPYITEDKFILLGLLLGSKFEAG